MLRPPWAIQKLGHICCLLRRPISSSPRGPRSAASDYSAALLKSEIGGRWSYPKSCFDRSGHA
jgi:hypothetical protein